MTWYRFPIGALAAFSAVACDPGSTACDPGERIVAGDCVAIVERAVHLNSVGFLPGLPKRATFAGGSGAFHVIDVKSGEVVFEGTASAPVNSSETEEEGLRVADFSDLDDEGEYQLVAEGAGDSTPFRIAPDVMSDVLKALMLGMYGQRCGEAVSFQYAGSTFSHGVCHTADGLLDDLGEANQQHDALYGWHDAGDYGKYVNNGALTLANMLFAWQQFPALKTFSFGLPDAGGLPEYLAECKFQLDWLLGMQLEGGGVSDRVTTRTFDGMVSPEASTNPRYLAPVTSTATADFAGVVARAARAFEGYDDELAATYREAALAAWNYLLENPEPNVPSRDVQQRYTGAYWSSDQDDRLWAAAEIYELTGDEAALALFEERAPSLQIDGLWDWPTLTNLATFTYLLSTRDDRDPELVETLTTTLGRGVDSYRSIALAHPYGRATGSQYYWGINGVLARGGLNVGVYEALVPRAENREVLVSMLDHLLGRNYYGRSYVTGVGEQPPYSPHHRPSASDDNAEPWPGLLIGGPETEATDWVDSAADYRTNEVAINWNGAMIYTVAALIPNE